MSKINHLFWDDEIEDWQTDQPTMTRYRRSYSPEGFSHLLPDCRHWRQKFVLEDGLAVFASARLDRPREDRDDKRQGFGGHPDIGFYLDAAWGAGHLLVTPGWRLPFGRGRRYPTRVVVYPWPDYGVPVDPRRFGRAIDWLLDEARSGSVIEIGCAGGHGRTGTTLACLLVAQGIKPKSAIRRTRRRYCFAAIESSRQEDFVRAIAGLS